VEELERRWRLFVATDQSVAVTGKALINKGSDMQTPSKSERAAYLNSILGKPVGRHYVVTEYNRAAGLPPGSRPASEFTFAQIIETIIKKEYPD
jgi:hypothetical protein